MRVIPGDWLTNAGIMGYLRMRKMAGKKMPDLSKGFIKIDPTDLDRFADWYFTHVLMRKAEEIFRHSSNIFLNIKLDTRQSAEIRSKFDESSKNSFAKIKQDYNNFDATLQSVIRTTKLFEKMASMVLETKLAEYSVPIKDIRRAKKKLHESISDNIQELRDKNLKFVQKYLSTFYKNKKIIGNYSSRATKKLFQDTYVKPAMKLLDPHAISSKGFLCRFCRQNHVIPNKFDDSNSIFSEGMFSTTALTLQFRNFFYNMQPDLFVCEVCELLLISAWAGFTEIPYRYRDKINNEVKGTNYIFVNLPTLELLWDENKKVQDLYEQDNENLQGTIYQDIIGDIFLTGHKMKARWTLKNILFIEIKTTSAKHSERPDFRYFHVGEDIAELFTDENEYAANALKYITGRVNISNGLDINLRHSVVARILEHDSLFPLCYSLILAHLDNNNRYALRNVFNISLISSIRASINTRAGREKSRLLESKQIYGILRNIQSEGGNFGNVDYDVRKRKSYILLSMIRNGRIEEFYDIVMKIYMSQNKPIPESLVSLLNGEDEIGFQARAYAFMSGFLGGNHKPEQQR